MNPQVIVIILLLVGVGAYLLYTQQQQKEEIPTPTPTPTEPTPTTPTTPAEPRDVVSTTKGLVGWWDGPSYDATTRVWKDKSDTKNDVTTISGVLSVSKNGEEVQGDKDTALLFPEMDLDDFTLFHVTKYNGPTRARIFTTKSGSGQNIFIGHHAGKSGVYHADGWMTKTVNLHGDDWVLSVATPSMYRSNGAARMGYYNEPDTPIPEQLTINGWEGEESDWSVKEIILYNRTLKPEEYMALEKHLMTKHDVQPKRYHVTDLTGGTSDNTWPELFEDVQFVCGPGEALTSFQLSSTNNAVYSCMGGIDLEGEEISGQTLPRETEPASTYYKNLQNEKIDCGESPINSIKITENDDSEMQYKYTCNSSKVKPNTCSTHYGEEAPPGSSVSALASLTNTKCPNTEVMTSAKLIETSGKQKWELTCCKPKGI